MKIEIHFQNCFGIIFLMNDLLAIKFGYSQISYCPVLCPSGIRSDDFTTTMTR